MTRTNVQSSQIASIGYDPETATLHVEFLGRPAKDATPKSPAKPAVAPSVYEYADVPPEIGAGMLAAESPYGYFCGHVKSKFDYKRL